MVMLERRADPNDGADVEVHQWSSGRSSGVSDGSGGGVIGWLPKKVLAKSIYLVHLRAVRFLPVTDVCVFRPPHDSIVKAQASPTQPAVLGPP